ncbi:hypothetical protein BJP08_10885 [Corynebacterium sp. NML140438]|uniref:HtaA domain-containing protein n=1 Tax=Corynebacterium sp. NML140438 TaxID=1906334 RepID=UPI0008FB3D4E|nr:HtaA domain-containing protein [Corynebacterium sp. NML140438]OIR40440.1 hypothetical protein BJP08_10885 [Corynebacterium sp. NML140438]
MAQGDTPSIKNTALANGVAIAIAASALIAPQATAIEDGSSLPLGTTQVASGTFTWPIKQSLLQELNKNANLVTGAGVYAKDQATFNPTTNLVTFPLDVADTRLDANGNGVLHFDGELKLHGTVPPKVDIDDIKITIAGTNATITGDIETGTLLEREHNDVVLGTFQLDKAIDPAQPSFSIKDRPVTYGIGITPLGLKVGDTPTDANANLDLTFGKADLSSRLNIDTEDKLKAAGIALGVLAALGAIAAVVAGPLKDLLPFDLPVKLPF